MEFNEFWVLVEKYKNHIFSTTKGKKFNYLFSKTKESIKIIPSESKIPITRSITKNDFYDAYKIWPCEQKDLADIHGSCYLFSIMKKIL